MNLLKELRGPPPIRFVDEDFGRPPYTGRRGFWYVTGYISLRGRWEFAGLTAEWARYHAYRALWPEYQIEVLARRRQRLNPPSTLTPSTTGER